MRLIDADVLIKQAVALEAEALEYVAKDEPSLPPERWHIWNAKLNERTLFKYDLVDAPTVDAVPVVRCKDCNKRDVCRTSNIWATPPADDWFCADGERREDDSEL